MIRVRLPAGVCTPAQWLAIDQIADEHGMPALGWEAHGALARVYRTSGRLAAADQQAAIAETIVERVVAGLNDEDLRAGVRERAKASLG